MARRFIPFSVTNSSAAPYFIDSSTLATGNNYGEATGIGEQVWRYEALTGSSILELDSVASSEGNLSTCRIKFRIPQSNQGRIQLEITDNSNNGHAAYIDGGRVLFSAPVANGVTTSPDIVATYQTIQQPTFIELQQNADTVTVSGWGQGVAYGSALRVETVSQFASVVGRKIRLRITAPAAGVSLLGPVLYDLHWFGIGTGSDNANVPTSAVGGLKNVTGTVRAPDGTPVTQPYPVRLCHRATGNVLSRGMTDTSGHFSLTANVPASEVCYVLSVDTRQEQWTSAITGNI